MTFTSFKEEWIFVDQPYRVTITIDPTWHGFRNICYGFAQHLRMLVPLQISGIIVTEVQRTMFRVIFQEPGSPFRLPVLNQLSKREGCIIWRCERAIRQFYFLFDVQ